MCFARTIQTKLHVRSAHDTESRMQPVLGKARHWLTTGLALFLFVLLALMYKAVRYDHTSELTLMTAVAQELRRLRAAAKKRLLHVCTEHGVITISRTKRLRWWASGPRDADIVIALAAEDGENAVLWGAVHADVQQLVDQVEVAGDVKVRVVTYDTEDGSVPTVPEPSSLYEHRSLSLRLSDLHSVLRAASDRPPLSALHLPLPLHERERGGGWGRWLAALFGMGSGGSTPCSVLLVSSGAGVWASLAHAGLYPGSTLGAVLVAPQVQRRGAHTVWQDAVAAASRVAHEQEPELLAKLLEAPPLQAGDMTVELAKQLDKRNPRVQTSLEYYSGWGIPGWSEAVAKRHREDVRRERARQYVFSSLEHGLLQQVGPAATRGWSTGGGDAQGLRVHALVAHPQALPPWLNAERALPHMYANLYAANTVGLYMSPAPVRADLEKERADTVPLVQAEITRGVVSVPVGIRGKERQAVDTAEAADILEKAHIEIAFRKLPSLLGLDPPPIPTATFPYLAMEHEYRALPRAYSLSMVHTQDAAGITCIPLQCPGAVAASIYSVLTQSLQGQGQGLGLGLGRGQVQQRGEGATARTYAVQQCCA